MLVPPPLDREERRRGRAGVKDRDRRMGLYPICAHCDEEGIIRETDVIDHIIPLWKGVKAGGVDTDENCQGLCHKHHDIKTAQEAGERAGKPIYGYDENGYPLDPNHPWNL